MIAGNDPNVGSLLNRVYSGNYSYRAEDTTWGGYASAITQTVTNWTDNNIFFAWAAVLEVLMAPTTLRPLSSPCMTTLPIPTS